MFTQILPATKTTRRIVGYTRPLSQTDYYRLYAILNQDADELVVADIKGDTSFRNDISPDLDAESPLLRR